MTLKGVQEGSGFKLGLLTRVKTDAEIKTLAPFKAAAEERVSEVDQLKQQLEKLQQQKKHEIQKLEARLAQLDGMQHGLKEHQTTIVRLKTQLRDARREQAEISTLKVELRRRDATIEDLRKQLAEAENRAKVTANRPQSAKRPAHKKLYKPTQKKDDLKLIYGIGPVMERTLNRLGVTSFEQIARFTRKDIERVAEALQSFPDRIVRDNWVEGAKKEYQKKYPQKKIEPI